MIKSLLPSVRLRGAGAVVLVVFAFVAAPGVAQSMSCAADPTALKDIWPAQVPRS